MRALVLIVAVAGCLDFGGSSPNHPVDACSDPTLATERCVTVNLQPSAALMGAEITQVSMWVIYSEAGTSHGQNVITPMEQPSRLPVALGLHLPINLESEANLYVTALNGPGYAAYGKGLTDPSPGIHEQLDIMMADYKSTGCFDRVFSANQETDVDCGDNCPPCASGQHCVEATDCQSGNCVFDTNTDQELCQ